MGAREDETEDKQEALLLSWQDSGPRNSHLLVLLQWLWADSVSGASSVCLRLQAVDLLRAQRQWHSPGQQLPAPQPLQPLLPALLPAWWELKGALLRALNHYHQLSFSRIEKL